jgi:hypothetical protein
MELQQAYDHFNAALFDGKLPPCLITLRAQRASTPAMRAGGSRTAVPFIPAGGGKRHDR